jgi:hypothetical protein
MKHRLLLLPQILFSILQHNVAGKTKVVASPFSEYLKACFTIRFVGAFTINAFYGNEFNSTINYQS